MPARRGLSLMEVLISLVIFLGALVVIGRLILLGGERALEVKFEAQATQLCQAKLAEVVAGVVPLEGQSGIPFDEDPTWTWSLEVEADDVLGLWRVLVRVQREERPELRKIECTLSQRVLDPSLRGGSNSAATPTGTAATSIAGNSIDNATSSKAPSSASKGPPSSGGKGPPNGDGKGLPKGGSR